MTTARKSPRAAPDWVESLDGIIYPTTGISHGSSIAYEGTPPAGCEYEPPIAGCHQRPIVTMMTGCHQRQIVTMMSRSYTAKTTQSNQVLAALPVGLYRTIKYTVQAALNSSFQSCEISLIHDDNGNISIVQYANNTIGSNLAQFDADIVGGKIRLLTTPSAAGVVFNVLIIAIIN